MLTRIPELGIVLFDRLPHSYGRTSLQYITTLYFAWWAKSRADVPSGESRSSPGILQLAVDSDAHCERSPLDVHV